MNLRPALRAGGLLLLTGCTTVNDLHPNFKGESAAMQTVAITTDVMVLEDVRGPLPLVDVPRDLDLAAELNQFLRDEFEKRGVKVAAAEVSSIGLRYGAASSQEIKVRPPGVVAAGAPVDALGTAAAPFHLDPAYAKPAPRSALQNVFEDVRRFKDAPKGPNMISFSVPQLPPAPAGVTHRVFVLVEGVQVPASKGLAQALLTSAVSLGRVSTAAVTDVNFRIGIADVATGEFILVDNCTISGGWTVDADYLRRQAGIFFSHFDRLRK